jgi:hypothetical protein
VENLSASFRRLATLLEPEVARMVARQAAAIPRFDETHYDGAQEVATFYDNGEIVWRARAEPIGRYSGEFGLFRWWWHGQASHTRRARLDRARTEASRYDIQEFTVDHVYVSSDAEAMLVARVAAQLAQAHGVMEKTDEFGTSFVALFERTNDASQAQRANVQAISAPPAPPASGRPSIAPPVASLSMPPAPAPSSLPPPAREIRPPDQAAVVPLATLAFAIGSSALAEDLMQVLLVVVVDVADARGRFFTSLTGCDLRGDMHSLDATRELTQASATFIADELRNGNGRWRKLAVRVTKTPRGGTVEASVS